MGRCPFHEDKTPSFGVTPSRKPLNCSGRLRRRRHHPTGDEKGGVSFRHAACEILRRKTGETPAVRFSLNDAPEGHAAPGSVDPATAAG